MITAIPTVRGAYRLAELFARGSGNWPASWNWHLGTNATTLTNASVTMAAATQPTGGGYSSSGYALAQNSTDFPTWDFFDGVTQIGIFEGGYTFTKQLSLAASGGNIDFQYWILADNNVTVNSRELYTIGDAGKTETISDGKTGFFDIEIRVTVNSPFKPIIKIGFHVE